VVCEDLNAKEFKYRILVVGSREKWHRPLGSFSRQEIKRFIELGQDIAQRHIRDGLASRVVETDMIKHSIPEHFHIQLCMR